MFEKIHVQTIEMRAKHARSIRVKSDKKRLLLITPMLHQGGFERICVLTARLLQDQYEVYLAVFSMQDLFYDVSGLRVIDLQVGSVKGGIGKIWNIYRRIKRLRKLKKELHIDVSYSFGTTANIANVLSKYQDTTWAGIRGYSALSDRGATLIFRRADCVISCTKTMESDINRMFGTKKSATLYNPCDLSQIRLLSEQKIEKEFEPFLNSKGPLIASMGREDDLKGFWHLIKSFAVVKRTFSDAKLMIIGDGDYTEYKELAKKLGVLDSILFTGVQKNPFALLAKADIYALTSQSEGFPNALIEAMACKVACVSVNCKTGPAEILSDWPKEEVSNGYCQACYGILTPVFEGEKDLEPIITQQETQYAQELTKLLEDSQKRAWYRDKGQERAADFGIDRYVETIVNLIEG